MKPKAKKDPKSRQSSRFFERIAVETFSENQLNFFGLDAAQSLFQMEKFLVDFAEKDAIFHKMFDNEKSTFSILHRRLRSFFVNLSTIVTFPYDNKIRYSEHIEIFLQWYKENKEDIYKIINYKHFSVTESEPEEKAKERIIKVMEQLFDQLNTNSNKNKLDQRYRVMDSNVKKITRYINDLAVIYPHHLALRIDFGYQKEANLSDKLVNDHMAHFYKTWRHKPALFGMLCGYITKLEFSYYRGYYWRTLFFFDGLNPVNAQEHLENIGHYWQEKIVGKEGDFKIATIENTTTKSHETLIEKRIQSVFFNESAQEAAQYLCQKDAFIRPITKTNKLLRTGQINANTQPKVIPESVPRGRKPQIDAEQVKNMHRYGLGATEIAKQLDISRSSVCKILKLQKSSN
jgi:hypothetical protein